VIQLNPAGQKNIQIRKHSVLFIILANLILPGTPPAKSAFVAAAGDHGTGGSRNIALDSLQDPGGFKSKENLARGKFLVAGRKLQDPNFSKTVLLLIRYGQDGAAGLVINRPSTVKVSTVIPEIKESDHRQETFYLGGPVEPNKVLLLLKTKKPPDESIQVFDNVYISSSRKELLRLIENSNKNEKFRIYAGYAGWAPKQLESECDRGDWYIIAADTQTLFDKKSSEIWPALIHRFTVNWVNLKSRDHSVIELGIPHNIFNLEAVPTAIDGNTSSLIGSPRK
jgi:putative transcriptional regulator